MWFAHDCAQATWAYILETVRSAVRRLSKISNCDFECDYSYYYYYYYHHHFFNHHHKDDVIIILYFRFVLWFPRGLPSGDVPRQPERPHHPVSLRPGWDRSVHRLSALVRHGRTRLSLPRADPWHAGWAGARAVRPQLPQCQFQLVSSRNRLRTEEGIVVAVFCVRL